MAAQSNTSPVCQPAEDGIDHVGKEMLAALEGATAVEVQTAPKPEVSANADVAEGTAPAAAQTGTCECSKCKLMKPVKGKAVARQAFCCRQCSTKRSTLSQIFGHWPIPLFSDLPPHQQIAFWQSEAKGKVNIKNALVKEVTDYRHEEQSVAVGGTYLPISVLKAKGFDTELVEKNCTDTEEHPVLGKTYNLNLKTVTKEEITRKVWKEIFKYTGADANAQGSKEKKKKKDKTSSKKREKSSASESSASSSCSTSRPKLTAAQQRQRDAQQRMETLAAAQEAKKAAKEAEASRAKYAAAAAKVAAEDAKKTQKEKLASQAAYTSLFNAHAQLVADMAVVPVHLHTFAAYVTGEEVCAAGEELMNQCLDAMKNKTDLDKVEVKNYIAGLKKVAIDIQKLAKKRLKK